MLAASTCAPDRSHHPGVAPTVVLAAGLLGSAYVWRTDPHVSGHLLPVCPFRMLTGWQCPACGGTRLVYDLLHADVARAWQDNALLLLVLPLLLWSLGRWAVEGWRGRSYRVVLPRYGGPLVVAVAVAWAVLRNLF
jgi:hypothetical protein